jgi:hypothetical protein
LNSIPAGRMDFCDKQTSKQSKFLISLCVCRGGARRKQHLTPLVSFLFIHVFVA